MVGVLGIVQRKECLRGNFVLEPDDLLVVENVTDVIISVTKDGMLLDHVGVEFLASFDFLVEHSFGKCVGISLIEVLFNPPETLITHATEPPHEFLPV